MFGKTRKDKRSHPTLETSGSRQSQRLAGSLQPRPSFGEDARSAVFPVSGAIRRSADARTSHGSSRALEKSRARSWKSPELVAGDRADARGHSILRAVRARGTS